MIVWHWLISQLLSLHKTPGGGYCTSRTTLPAGSSEFFAAHQSTIGFWYGS